jgi:uncharacterized protein (DUF1778 family)
MRRNRRKSPPLKAITEQLDITLPPAQWDAFCKALDAPARSIPALKKLFTQPSVFDGTRKRAAR